MLTCLAALLTGLSLFAQTISCTLCWQLPNSGPFPRTPDSTANLPPPQHLHLEVSQNRFRELCPSQSPSLAQWSKMLWYCPARLVWELRWQKTLFLTDFWTVSPHLLSAIFQAGLLKTAASWHPHFHLCILFPSRQPGILSRPLSKRFTRATLCSNPSWRPTSLRKNQSPSNGLSWPYPTATQVLWILLLSLLIRLRHIPSESPLLLC